MIRKPGTGRHGERDAAKALARRSALPFFPLRPARHDPQDLQEARKVQGGTVTRLPPEAPAAGLG